MSHGYSPTRSISAARGATISWANFLARDWSAASSGVSANVIMISLSRRLIDQHRRERPRPHPMPLPARTTGIAEIKYIEVKVNKNKQY
jgi:hypothetical protein